MNLVTLVSLSHR